MQSASRDTARDTARKPYRAVLLFGAPGAGKGTIGKVLGSIPGFVHLACGDIFRNLDLTSPLGKTFVDYSSRGLLVPDDHTIALWKETIDSWAATRIFSPERDVLVLDGIPRNVEQARIIDPYLQVEKIFYLVCSDENLMIERLRRRALKENRLDDASDEVIRRRWRVYEEETQPVLDSFPAETIQQVDAIGTPVEVLYTILGHLVADIQASRKTSDLRDKTS